MPADKDTLSRLAQNTGGSFHTAASARGAALGLPGHRLADRLHDAAQGHQLAVPGHRRAVHVRGRRRLAAVVRPARLRIQSLRDQGPACRWSCGPAAPGARRRPAPAGSCRRRPGAARRPRSGRAGRCTASASSAGRWATCTSQKPITAVLRAIRAAGLDRASAACAPAIPNTASRPNGASAARLWSNTGPPVISSTTSTRRPPLASRRAAVRSPAVESTATSAPSRGSARASPRSTRSR